jgi:CheY-like chemotaxis protein
MVESAARILVVDDVEMNRDVLSRRLERLGHSIVTANDGREALDVMRTQPFDLVLLDIMMPEMNGYEVLEALKQDPALRHIPVIMISAIGEIDSVVKCIQLGAEDYLGKPFNPTLLKARVGACLEKKRLRDQERSYLSMIEAEKSRYEDLLQVILPTEIVAELKENNEVRPRKFEDVAVMFCDIVGFTTYCQAHAPEEVVSNLQQVVEVFEEIAHKYELEKIKTIGDAFMAASGLLTATPNPVLQSVRCGLEMIEAVRALPVGWQIRIGIHVGPVLAGVIGRRKYLFDLWGDTVNSASRMESHGLPGYVNLSKEAWLKVADFCEGTSRGILNVKGIGDVEMFKVEAVKPASAVPA